MRINKFLSEIGYCSRRQADRLIEEKKIKIDDQIADMGTRIAEGQKVYVQGKAVGTLEDLRQKEEVLLAVNKPVGIVCTTTDNDRAKNIVELVRYPTRVYPIGRLDKDSRGLILLTNQGKLVNAIMKASGFHEKEYIVQLDRDMDEGFIEKMQKGVFLHELNVKTRRCKVVKESNRSFRIILTQGLNRQIRRMCEELGYHVEDLKRERIMNITLGDLAEGEYRRVSKEEMEKLMEAL